MEVFFCFLPLRPSTFPIRRNLLSCFLRDSHFTDAAPPAIRGASAKLWKEAIQGDPFRLKSSKFLNLCDASQGNLRKKQFMIKGSPFAIKILPQRKCFFLHLHPPSPSRRKPLQFGGNRLLVSLTFNRDDVQESTISSAKSVSPSNWEGG